MGEEEGVIGLLLPGNIGEGEEARVGDGDSAGVPVYVRVCLLNVSTKRLKVSISFGSTSEVMNA